MTQVEFRERQYTVGRVPTTWNKSEGPPGQREMLASSTIEQALRPLFPPDFTFDTQVRCCKPWPSTVQFSHALQLGHAVFTCALLARMRSGATLCPSKREAGINGLWP
jgi:hypothetical protein